MKKIIYLLLIICFSSGFISCKGQKTFGADQLIIQKIIALPGVHGRIDHIDMNLKDGMAYIAALGNNSLEVVDIGKGKFVYSIKGLDEPQGVAYIPQQQEIFVANGGSGDCYFYDAHSYKKTATIHLSSDADDVRYDSASEKIYVGYGNGGIAIIDARQRQQISDIRLPGHPEGFQLDKTVNKLFVNIPDAHQIATIDLLQMKVIGKWSTGGLRANFPLAVDATRHYLFIGYRHPSKLVVMDESSGNSLTSLPLVSDADDLYADEKEGKIYASGGGGFIGIYQWQKLKLQQTANIPVQSGARTSLFIPSSHLFLLAERANGKNGAQLKVYKTL